MLSTRDGTGFGFRTSRAEGTTSEEYYYVVEITPLDPGSDPDAGARMTPVLDEVIISYMPKDTPDVIHEAELIYDDLDVDYEELSAAKK